MSDNVKLFLVSLFFLYRLSEIFVGGSLLDRPLIETQFMQDEQKIFNRRLVAPDPIGVNVDQRFSRTFPKARSANARGLANNVAAYHRVPKYRAELIKKKTRGAIRVAARPGADHEPPAGSGAAEDIFDEHGATPALAA